MERKRILITGAAGFLGSHLCEGVETIEQANILLDKDCDDVQGYFFSRPLCEADFCQLLTKMQAESV